MIKGDPNGNFDFGPLRLKTEMTLHELSWTRDEEPQ